MPVTDPAGLLAEFADADALVAAAVRVRATGYTRAEAFAPYPLPDAAAALGYRWSAVPAIVFVGGLTGAVGGYFMQYWAAAVDYPVNVGGRPLDSWPLFIPITFEMTVLIAAFCSFLGMLLLCGLPRFHHPLFASPRFSRASGDGFFLFVEATDPRFDPADTRRLLSELDPLAVEEVAA